MDRLNLSSKEESFCKYCEKNRKLCKAHIVPKSFFQAIKQLDSAEYLYVLDGENTYESKTKIGFYDNHILCSKCDNELGVYDNNFFRYLTTTNFNLFRKELYPYHYYQLNIDSKTYLDIKLFFASLLYRASLSKISFSRNVNLGDKYEQIIKDFIKRKCYDIHELAVMPIKLHSSKVDTKTALSGIYREKIDGINCYSIVLYGFKFFIKIDKRPAPKIWKEFLLREGEIFILEIDFEKTNDYRAAVELAKKFKNKQ